MATTTPEPVKAIRASGWPLLAAGVISVVAGILALIVMMRRPGETLLVLLLALGLWLVLSGIVDAIHAGWQLRKLGALAPT